LVSLQLEVPKHIRTPLLEIALRSLEHETNIMSRTRGKGYFTSKNSNRDNMGNEKEHDPKMQVP
jgi:hypothetical protein